MIIQDGNHRLGTENTDSTACPTSQGSRTPAIVYDSLCVALLHGNSASGDLMSDRPRPMQRIWTGDLTWTQYTKKEDAHTHKHQKSGRLGQGTRGIELLGSLDMFAVKEDDLYTWPSLPSLHVRFSQQTSTCRVLPRLAWGVIHSGIPPEQAHQGPSHARSPQPKSHLPSPKGKYLLEIAHAVAITGRVQVPLCRWAATHSQTLPVLRNGSQWI